MIGPPHRNRGAAGDGVKRIMMLCILGCTGCGDDEQALPQCNDLADDLCTRIVQCAPQQAPTQASCLLRLEQTLPCELAHRISATYGSCLQHIMTDSCHVLFPTDPFTTQAALSLPADCTGVVQIDGPGAPLVRSSLGAVRGLAAMAAD
jgi:hypothetical protein